MAESRLQESILREVASLDGETAHRHRRAAGFTEAGFTRLARRELSALPPAARELNCARALRLELAQRESAWDEVLEIATRMAEEFPEESHLRITRAYAARRCRSLEEAEAILVQTVKEFPEEGLPHYNLACYAAARGDKRLAKARLRKAIGYADGYLAMAADDEDFACIRDWVLALHDERWPDK